MKTEFLSLLAFMKKLTVSILAIPTMAAGVAAAAAQSSLYFDINAKDYSLNAQFNNPPNVVSAAGLPTPALTDLEPMLQGAIGTDGSGKIDGVQYARVYFGGAANHTNNYATFIVNVTGSIRTKGTTPSIKMTMKGNGYDMDAQSDRPDASLTLTFTSTAAPATVSPSSQSVVVNSANYTVTYLNGSPVLLTTNEPTVYSGYYVNPINYAVTFLFTNGPATFANNNRYSRISGTLTGTIKPGKKSSVNGGKPLKINEPAALISESWIWTLVDDTNVVAQSVGGSLIANVLSNITAQVVQPYPGSKLYLAGGVGSTLDPYSGTGTVNNKTATYKLKLKGASSARGAALDVNGTLGSVIIGYQPTTNANFPTGYVTNYLLNAIKQISFSGKAAGQKIPSTSGVNADAAFPSVP